MVSSTSSEATTGEERDTGHDNDPLYVLLLNYESGAGAQCWEVQRDDGWGPPNSGANFPLLPTVRSTTDGQNNLACWELLIVFTDIRPLLPTTTTLLRHESSQLFLMSVRSTTGMSRDTPGPPGRHT